MKNVLGIILVVIIIWGAVNFFSSDEWLPTYYPNPSDLTTYSNGPIFDTLEQCRDWVDAEAIRRGQALGEYDYECGLNCELDNTYGLFVCDETVQ